jgi:hypothetical protein
MNAGSGRRGSTGSFPGMANTQKNRLSPLSLPVATGITDLRVVKRRRSIQDGDTSNHAAKRPKRHDIREQVRPRPGHHKDEGGVPIKFGVSR